MLQVVYSELHAMAAAQMGRQSPAHTLQPTALVNEAWMKLVHLPNPEWSDRRHFLKVGAKAMRSVLVDHVRAQRRVKRDGGAKLTLNDALLANSELEPLDVIALDEALAKLDDVDTKMAELVELRFFGGRSMQEAAECLGVSLSTAERTWRAAKAWLFRALSESR